MCHWSHIACHLLPVTNANSHSHKSFPCYLPDYAHIGWFAKLQKPLSEMYSSKPILGMGSLTRSLQSKGKQSLREGTHNIVWTSQLNWPKGHISENPKSPQKYHIQQAKRLGENRLGSPSNKRLWESVIILGTKLYRAHYYNCQKLIVIGSKGVIPELLLYCYVNSNPLSTPISISLLLNIFFYVLFRVTSVSFLALTVSRHRSNSSFWEDKGQVID